MLTSTVKLNRNSALAVLSLLAAANAVIVSISFAALSFAWFAWSILGYAAIIVFWRECVDVTPNTEHGSGFLARNAGAIKTVGFFIFVGALTAAVEVPSPSWVLLLAFGFSAVITLIRMTIGVEERRPENATYTAAITHRGSPHLTSETVAAIKTEIEYQWSKGQHAAVIWPPRPDWDRLELVFAELEKAHVLVLWHQFETDSEARDDAQSQWRRRGESQSGLIGYVYYLRDDLDVAVDGGKLSLAFGDFERAEMPSHVLGDAIVASFKSVGLEAVLPAHPDGRITVDLTKSSPTGAERR
jgi:hypothetical protein